MRELARAVHELARALRELARGIGERYLCIMYIKVVKCDDEADGSDSAAVP